MGAKVRFDQCLQGFAACLSVEVNITHIVGMSARNRPKCVVFDGAAAVGVGHFGPLPKPDRVSARRSQASRHAPSGPSSGPDGSLRLSLRGEYWWAGL